MNFVVLCSSHGTTFQAILDRIADGSLTAKCVGLITDRKDRGCTLKAKKAKVPVTIVEHKKNEPSEEYDKKIFDAIRSFEAPPHVMLRCEPFDGAQDRLREPRSIIKEYGGAPPAAAKALAGKQDDMYVVCVGWMHIFSPWFIQQFPNRILNVHPALLPKYGGKGMYGSRVHEEVLSHREKESGMTIHIVTKEVDQGPILLQKKCPVLPGDTPETLQKRVQELEKEWYPKVLQMLNSPPPFKGEG